MQFQYTAGTRLPTLRIRASNSANDLSGSIHDDQKARSLGFAGGLVPGVTLLGYMSRLMYETFGRNWLSHGRFSARLRRPVYEGMDVTVDGVITEVISVSNGDHVRVELKVIGDNGDVAAYATATCWIPTDA